MHLKPNPDNMTSKLNDEDEDSESDVDSDAEGKSSSKKEAGIYKPPMMSAAYFGMLVAYSLLDGCYHLRARTCYTLNFC